MKSMQPASKTLIIAEVGVNHNGDLKIAKELIKEAALAGADVVKFQTFNADVLVTENAPKAAYQKTIGEVNDSNYAMLKSLELSREDHLTLIKECNLHGIEFFSTGFDIDSLNFLLELKMNRIKIPSGEITNLPFLEHVATFNLPVILSTGMADIEEIERALDILLGNKLTKRNLSILHCTSLYPAPFESINLNAIPALKHKFNINVGYSDHTLGIEAAIAAVSLGAKIIEKHITMDVDMPGPDHKASITPSDFSTMVSAIRNIEIGLGDGHKLPGDSELEMRAIARKSLIASKKINEGEILTADHIAIKRPGNGISPMKLHEVIGTKAVKSFLQDDLIET
jgi:N,N'-diacetyllegionaminate synthase